MVTVSELSSLDAAFLCLEHPHAPMHVGALAVFDPPGEVRGPEVAELLADRAGGLPLLRQRLRGAWPPGWALRWEPDQRLDPGEHVRVHELPWPGGTDELTDLAAGINAEPLDTSRPLWELHVITGLQDGSFAVLVKLHHALADGAQAVEVGLGLLDGLAPEPGSAEPEESRSASGGWIAAARPERLWGHARATVGRLGRVVGQAAHVANIGASVARHARVPSAASPLLAPPSEGKRLALLALEVADLRRVGRRFGVTTNDVLLAVITGAVRMWLTSRGHPVDTVAPRALIPVNHRARTSGPAGNNQLSGYLCDLPVADPEPRGRLHAVHSQMCRSKSTGPLHGPGALPVLAGYLPSILHRLITPVAGRCGPLLFDTVITNVPLPGVPVALNGAGLRAVYPLLPVAAGHTLSIATSRYGDRIHVGLQALRDELPDLEKLHEALPRALAELDDLGA